MSLVLPLSLVLWARTATARLMQNFVNTNLYWITGTRLLQQYNEIQTLIGSNTITDGRVIELAAIRLNPYRVICPIV